MRVLTVVSMLFALALVSASTYLRLNDSGIGCADWPACYGLAGAGQEPGSWIVTLLAVLAGIVCLLVLSLALVSLRRRRGRFLPLVLPLLAAVLVWFSVFSRGAITPMIVMGSLAGGFALLGVLGWMAFRDARPHANASHKLRRWVLVALVLLCAQIALGGLTSANFAATACPSLPDCNGAWLPGRDVAAAFDLAAPAAGGAARAGIHQLHRLVAVVTALAVLVAGGLAIAGRMGATAIIVIALVILEFLVGVGAVLKDLPIGIAVAHNLLAAILLLGLLRLHALCRNRQALL